jgi:hypothetical protein
VGRFPEGGRPRPGLIVTSHGGEALVLFQGMAVKIDYLPVADHTFVQVPDNPDATRYFDCWGGHNSGPTKLICSGQGTYEIANCYRQSWPLFDKRDTAGIGLYGLDGVCHQSANCFLISAGITLNGQVLAYGLTCYLYGVYGAEYPQYWLPMVYGPCATKYEEWAKADMAGDDQGRPPEEPPGAPDPLFALIRDLHAAAEAQVPPPDRHEVIADETAAVVGYLAPEVDAAQLRDVQLRYLGEKDELRESGLTGEELANRLNDLGHRVQQDLAERLPPDQYEKVLNVPAGRLVDIIEPAARRVAGEPVPLREP